MALTLGVAAPAPAQTHGPHVHGAARLNVALDGASIWLEATLPAADVVGFEHAPENETDRAAVSAAVATLQDAEALYVFPAEAGCRVDEAEVASELLEAGAGHDHDKDHADHKGDDRRKDADEADVDGHADFVATAIFRCAEPAKAVYVDVALFKPFPTLHEIDAQAVTQAGQIAEELTPEAPRLGLR